MCLIETTLVIACMERIGFTTKKLHDAINYGSTLLLLHKINNYGEMLENDILMHTKNKQTLFEKIAKK